MNVWTLKKDVILKAKDDKKLIKAGTDVTIFPESRNLVGITDIKFRIPWTHAYEYFDEVIEIDDEVMSNAIMDECVTVLGDSIEPDGKDSEGFPSVLIAMGIS